jgi:hypothetical protein
MSSIFLKIVHISNMISIQTYWNIDNLKIDNINVEDNFTFQIHLQFINKFCAHVTIQIIP